MLINVFRNSLYSSSSILIIRTLKNKFLTIKLLKTVARTENKTLKIYFLNIVFIRHK